MDGFKLASPSLSVYCDSPLSLHFRRAERMPWLSCMGAFFKSKDIDTLCFLESLSYWRWCGLSPVCLLVFFFCLCLGSSTHPPLCCPGRFRLHSAIQTMSGIMTARKKATGFSRFTMNRCRPTEAASKNRPDNYQQQLICVKLSQAVLVSLSSGSRSLVKGETENPGCLEEGLSRGINVNLSFRSCTWKGHSFSAWNLSIPLNQGHHTDPRSVRGH